MELRHLRYFRAVALERSFTRAAERLHVSQPPLSRQIRQLEEELGTPLFLRGTRPLELTEAGRVLLEHATQVLDRVEDVRGAMRALAKRRTRDLAVGFVGSVILGPLPRALRRFRAARPDITVRLVEMTTLEQGEALEGGRIDVGLGRLLLAREGVEQAVLWEEPLVVALSEDDAPAPPAIGLGELAGRPLLLYPRRPRPSYADTVLAAFRAHDLAPASVVEVGDIQVALGLVAAGAGAALVPAPAAVPRRDVVFRAVAEEGVVSPVVAGRRAGERDPDVDDFLGAVREAGAAEALIEP